MYKVMRCWIFIVIACLFFVGSLDFTEGKSKGPGYEPPGWDKGEKKGWHDDEPPGLEKKGKKEKLKKEKKEKKKKEKDKGEDDDSSGDKSDDDDSGDDDKKKKDKKK